MVAELLGELSCDESGIEGAVQRLQAQQAELAAQYGQASAPPVNPELEEALRALDDRVREVGRLSMLRATCCVIFQRGVSSEQAQRARRRGREREGRI